MTFIASLAYRNTDRGTDAQANRCERKEEKRKKQGKNKFAQTVTGARGRTIRGKKKEKEEKNKIHAGITGAIGRRIRVRRVG